MPRFPRTSPSTEGLSDRVFSALVQKAQQRGGTVHPLHVGDTYRDPIEAARAENQRGAPHRYAPVQGEPALLDAFVKYVAHTVGETVDVQDVQVVTGATSGLRIVADALFEPGDEVLLPSPFWPLIRGILRARGVKPVEIPVFTRLSEPGLDLESLLESQVTPRTAAIYVNTPNNPTGAVLSAQHVDAIARVAHRHDLWVLSDEAYADLYLDGTRTAAVWARPDLRERTIAAHTLSKSHGLAGARIGFLHGPRAAMQVVRGVQTFSTYCAARPMQLGAARALSEGDGWVAEARSLYADAAGKAAKLLGVPAPAGGTFLFFDAAPHLRAGETAGDFLERCLEAGVLLTPGTASGVDFERWIRLCFTSVPPAQFDQALAQLATVLAK